MCGIESWCPGYWHATPDLALRGAYNLLPPSPVPYLLNVLFFLMRAVLLVFLPSRGGKVCGSWCGYCGGKLGTCRGVPVCPAL